MITLAELSGLSKSQNNKKIKQANIYQPNSKLMFVGQEHGKKIVINEEIKKGNKYGEITRFKRIIEIVKGINPIEKRSK